MCDEDYEKRDTIFISLTFEKYIEETICEDGESYIYLMYEALTWKRFPTRQKNPQKPLTKPKGTDNQRKFTERRRKFM